MNNVKIFKNTMKKGVVFFLGLISIALGELARILPFQWGDESLFFIIVIGQKKKL